MYFSTIDFVLCPQFSSFATIQHMFAVRYTRRFGRKIYANFRMTFSVSRYGLVGKQYNEIYCL